MRAFATAALKKFGEHPALLTWRARARLSAFEYAYPDGDPRAKNPPGVRSDRAGAIADARRAVELAPRDPGILVNCGYLLTDLRDPTAPSVLKRYAGVSDPWPERRARVKARYPAYFEAN